MKNTAKQISLLAIILSLSLGFGQSLQAQDHKKDEVTIAKEVLETYLGKYQMGPDTLEIVLDGAEIKAKGPGYPPLNMKPKKQNVFYLAQFGVDVEFVKGDDGKIEKLLMIRGDGQELEAPKIE